MYYGKFRLSILTHDKEETAKMTFLKSLLSVFQAPALPPPSVPIETDTRTKLRSVHDSIMINRNLRFYDIENVHGSITINNSAIHDTDIRNVHGNIMITSDAVDIANIKNTHGGILIRASQSVRDVFMKAVHNHNGIVAPEITSVNIDATHGSAALKAEVLRDIHIDSTHKPVLIDARKLTKLENVSVHTTHSNLLVLIDPVRVQEISALVSKIIFTSSHGKVVMISRGNDVSDETHTISQKSYEEIKNLPGQTLMLS